MGNVTFHLSCRFILGFSCAYSSSCSKNSLLLCSTMLMCVGCFGLVVSTCQVIGYRKSPLRTP